jgi:hypothetical protein
VSRERAKRRAERLVVLEKEKAARARRSVRRQRRRALVNSLKPKRGPSSGTLYKRSRAQRTGMALRVVLIAMIVLVLPALVVVVLGRRF